MKKSLVVYSALASIFFIFSMFVLLSFFFPKINLFGEITGSAITTGTIALGVMESDRFFIDSPLNTTYNFAAGDPYILNLNITISGDLIVDNWTYSLWDLEHNELVNDTIQFSPNITFPAMRRGNNLTVKSNSSGAIRSRSVFFYVNVPNSAPALGPIGPNIYVCEDQSLSYSFNATDADEDDVTFDISPKNPFFVSPTSSSWSSLMTSKIISGNLGKEDIGVYEETVSVSDGEYVDTADTNITVVDFNHDPLIETVGVRTVWFKGTNITFYEQVVVSDTESGSQNTGNFTFNLTFLNGVGNLFNITNTGVINFTPTISQINVYNITLCVADIGISSPHPLISIVCSGEDGTANQECQNFSLTVTNQNRPPTIIDYYPAELNVTVGERVIAYFNLTGYDPDGTIPDTYWYVDHLLEEYDSGSVFEEFNYTFNCTSAGIHTVIGKITDGILNYSYDFVNWTINVTDVLGCVDPTCSDGIQNQGETGVDCGGPCAACTTTTTVVRSSGGGGGGGGAACSSDWAYEDWQICENLEDSIKYGYINGENYRYIKARCADESLTGKTCGFQKRTGLDLNKCNALKSTKEELQVCYYTERPDCSDGIQNCHDNSCEILVDCGGPCSACPTCSDKIQNQGEAGVDCGGPCAWKCKDERPLLKRTWILVLVLLILLILIIIAILKIVKILKYQKKVSK